jgi:hypothetical protein
MFEQLAQCVDQKLNGLAQQQIEQAAQKSQSHLG